MDIKLFIDADADVRLIRRLRARHRRARALGGRRSSASTRRRVRPMHLQFVEPSKRYADIIIPEGGHNRVAIDLLKTKIKDLLRDDVPPVP